VSTRERKVVTVLFADLVGFTSTAEQLDPEDVADILRPYHDRLRSELERWGGTVEKFIGDAVMALFGAPVTREDDPERAVRAALAIRDWIAEEGKLEVRIAVNTGEPLVGREREVAQIVDALERVREQRTSELLTLVGVPGIGKSRLLGELFQSIERSGHLTYWRQGRSLPYGQGVSYWALAEMVKAQAGILETDGDDEAEGKLTRAVEQLVDEDAGWVVAQLRPLVG